MAVNGVRSRGKEREKLCAFCDRTFTKEEHLKRHQRSHTGEKPFKCHICDRQYGRSDVLARHVQTHSAIDKPEQPGKSSVADGDMVEVLPRSSTGQNASDRMEIGLEVGQENAMPNVHPSAAGPSSYHPHLREIQARDLPHNSHSGNEIVSIMSQQYSEPWTAPLAADSLAHVDSANQPGIQQLSHLDQSRRHSGHHNHFLINEWEQSGQDPSKASQNDTTNLLADMSQPAITVYEPSDGIPPSAAFNVQHTEAGYLQRRSNRATADVAHDLDETAFEELPPKERQFSDMGHIRRSDLNFRLPSLPQSPGTDFYGGIESFRLPPDFTSFSPGMSYINLDNVLTPPPSRPTDGRRNSSKILFSVDQLQHIRRLWHGQRSAPSVQLMRSLWSMALTHPADNIFSVIQESNLSSAAQEPPLGRWQIDEQCRRDLMDFCTEIDERIHREDGADLGPQSAPSQSPASVSDTSSLPGLSIDGFPTVEALEASLDFFFRYFPFVFVHKATFKAHETQRSILFPMCLIGLATLYAERSKVFVVRHLKKLMRFCTTELTSKALGHCEPLSVLVTITSTLLVTYLALGFLEEAGHSRAHMLCAQMLHVAEKHGFFAARLGEDIVSLIHSLPARTEDSWKAWARVESSKRVVPYLLLLDSAYTRLQGAAGVVDIDKVEVTLPCGTVLFEAPNLPRFLAANDRGSSLVTSTFSVLDLHGTAPPIADGLSLQTILTMFYLRIAAARHRLPVGKDMGLTAPSLSPAEAFSREGRASEILGSIMLLPSLCLKQLQKGDTMSALAWNNLGLSLTADLDLLEVASGRKGLEAARTATEAVAKWSRSRSARRSILHAAQIFSILSSTRLPESNIARPDLLLFTSALVISMYLFVVDTTDDNGDTQPLELLDEVDWAGVGSEGVLSPQHSAVASTTREGAITNAALHFVRSGGMVSFAGEALDGGTNTARKILTNYVHLVDELGKWRGSRYSQLLRTMSDFAIEGSGNKRTSTDLE